MPCNQSLPKSSTSMENTRRRKSSSGEAFSFPSTPTQDEDDDHYQDSSFEFGCVTPDSPSIDPFKDSPADHLFFNGRLLPHSFPFQPGNGGFAIAAADNNNSRCFASRTSSISSSSKDDSLTTSRSNSTNSRSSSCSSSARTSYSDGCNYYYNYYGRSKIGNNNNNKRVSGHVYGSSQRWQFITTPVPSLSRENSRRRKVVEVAAANEELRSGKKHHQDRRNKVVVRYQLGRRLFRWFVSACKECHAIEPSTRKDKVLRPNVK